MSEFIKRQDAIDTVSKSYRYESDRMTALQELPVTNIQNIEERYDTHIVIKREDALKYLTEVEYSSLCFMLEAIARGREKDNKNPINSYYICNTDEPYAKLVHGIIIGGEAVKHSQLN